MYVVLMLLHILIQKAECAFFFQLANIGRKIGHGHRIGGGRPSSNVEKSELNDLGGIGGKEGGEGKAHWGMRLPPICKGLNQLDNGRKERKTKPSRGGERRRIGEDEEVKTRRRG
jgi:hypothetical protein